MLLGQLIDPGGRLALELRRRAQLVFQDPHAALDPRMRVAALIGEGLRHVAGLDSRERLQRVTRMLDEVGLAAQFTGRYPHELSGGQRQRVVIARALVTEPDLIVADEPVSALDVTVQAQVLALLERLQQRFGFAMLFVSHDLSVVGQVADRIAIMRHGRLLEHGNAGAILDRPTHPYTRELWSAAPKLSPVDCGYRLAAADPPPAAPPAGYRFAETTDADASVTVVRISPGHEVLCVAAA
jgi:peptide/nickel transport system ATP-binding protein